MVPAPPPAQVPSLLPGTRNKQRDVHATHRPGVWGHCVQLYAEVETTTPCLDVLHPSRSLVLTMTASFTRAASGDWASAARRETPSRGTRSHPDPVPYTSSSPTCMGLERLTLYERGALSSGLVSLLRNPEQAPTAPCTSQVKSCEVNSRSIKSRYVRSSQVHAQRSPSYADQSPTASRWHASQCAYRLTDLPTYRSRLSLSRPHTCHQADACLWLASHVGPDGWLTH